MYQDAGQPWQAMGDLHPLFSDAFADDFAAWITEADLYFYTPCPLWRTQNQ
jgi:hypothetical protein